MSEANPGTKAPQWIVTALVLSLLFRLFLLAFPELLPEEAYYWNYAIHLAPGYLDHPPFTAWLIALGTKIFGLNEFGVRSGAFVCALIAAFFVYRFSTLVAGAAGGLTALAIVALFPYFLGNSFYVSPDAGLVAAWAACIYFVLQIVKTDVSDSRQWQLWSWLGVWFGIGLLSKYTIVLLAASAFLVFLIEPKLRIWFRKPHPYVTVFIGALLFSPVIYWNATHEWASLVFQTSRRLSQEPSFALFDFLGHILLAATPVGLCIGVLAIFGRVEGPVENRAIDRFLKLSFALPVGIFLFFSLRHQPRLNWSGPPLLGLAPIFAQHLLGVLRTRVPFDNLLRRSWKPVLYFCLAGLVGFWTYLGLGIPGTGYSTKMTKTIGWSDLGRKILEVSRGIEQETGTRPFIIGMDKHYVAAELAFYLRRAALDAKVPPLEVAGRSMVGLESLMFQYWVPSQEMAGKPALLVARSKSDLEFAEVKAAFDNLGPIQEYRAVSNGKPSGQYFYRTGYRFLRTSAPITATQSSTVETDE